MFRFITLCFYYKKSKSKKMADIDEAKATVAKFEMQIHDKEELASTLTGKKNIKQKKAIEEEIESIKNNVFYKTAKKVSFIIF